VGTYKYGRILVAGKEENWGELAAEGVTAGKDTGMKVFRWVVGALLGKVYDSLVYDASGDGLR
jgi:hypothetical protein